jgi:hypothetical protein
LADLVSPPEKPAENTRHLTWLAGGGGRLVWGLVWLISPTAYGFLMISPNLHDIWPMFFLISFSLLKAGSFDVTQDLRRCLPVFIVGQPKIASTA